jgi:hypothetical protein
MSVSIGGRRFASCVSRAVSVRHADVGSGLGNVLRGADRGGAAILVVAPGCWSLPELAAEAVAGRRFRVVLSAGISDVTLNSLINASILPVSLTVATIAKVQDTVESGPGIVMTVDVDRGHVLAGRQLLARFGTRHMPGPWLAELADETESVSDSRAGSGETLAGRLLLAQRLLCSARLSGGDRIRLQRRLVAICDATKAPGADAARSARRLDRLLSDLARNSPDDVPEASARDQAPVGAAQASDLPGLAVGTRAGRREP